VIETLRNIRSQKKGDAVSTHPERSTADPGIPSQVPLPHAELEKNMDRRRSKADNSSIAPFKRHTISPYKKKLSRSPHIAPQLRPNAQRSNVTLQRLHPRKKSRSGVTSEKKSRFLPFYFLGHVLGCYAFAHFWALFLDQHCHPGQVIRSDCVNGWKTKK